ncbi:MAG TPA: aldo/keto reductase [Candidatus Binatia bacterium]|jgi:aryl-alcohol dehydrogenase-like predicted oxidoreductase|nr:aldo/keto reductase [Candidatus Binatia bacterium]
MEYRMLGKTGLRVSAVGLGTMVHAGHFGPMNDEESLESIDAALELGVNFIDTSDAYGSGYSEALLGKALKGRRDKVILATKGGNVMAGPDRGKRNFSADYIGRVMEESLKRLQTDYIDLYQLHNPTVEVIQEDEIWELLERQKKEGKIRHYGVSINKMEEGIASVKGGRYETIQIEYNLLDQKPAEAVFPLAQKANAGVVVRVPLRRGLLTGKLRLEDQKRFQGEDVRARNFAGEIFKRELEKVELLRFLEKPGRSLAQAAIAFCLGQPAVSVVIAGARNGKQMRENAAAADVKLSSDEVQEITDLWRSKFSE